MTEKQALGFVIRIKGLMALDHRNRGPEFWAKSIGLKGDRLEAVLKKYAEED